jgi:hypothetical protein
VQAETSQDSLLLISNIIYKASRYLYRKQDTGRRQGPNKLTTVTSACVLFHLYAARSSEVPKINIEFFFNSSIRSWYQTENGQTLKKNTQMLHEEIIMPSYSNIYPTRCNFTQFIYIWKLFYMFRVVPPPIIRRAYNCIYSICYCYLPLAADNSNGVTNTRCWRYSCMLSW